MGEHFDIAAVRNTVEGTAVVVVVVVVVLAAAAANDQDQLLLHREIVQTAYTATCL